jgi:ribonuclease Z
MSNFSVLVLGSASASPTLTRNPTAQLINVNEQYYLVDCGEGTQLQLRKYKIKFQRIHHIFISHLHGDHYLGLIGLIQTFHLLGRTNELNIYGPENLKEIIDLHLKHSQSTLRYPIVFHATNPKQSEIIFENNKLAISTIILKHRIPCTGFMFKEKPKPRKINTAAVNAFEIPKYALKNIKHGEDFTKENGEIIPNAKLTGDSPPSFSYAFCSDTKYNEDILPIINGVDLLYHEATFTEEHKDRAKSTCHSTAKEAATIALKAKAKCLIIGHFSNRYVKLDVLLDEAKSIFPLTELAKDGCEFEVSNPHQSQC